MAALSLELMDISRDWVSSSVMLCQVFTAADFSCCLFVGLSAFSFVFSEWNAAQSGWDQEIDSAIAEYSTFLPSKTPGLHLLYVLGHRTFVLWSAAQSTLLRLAESGQRVYPYIRLLLSSVSSSLNSSNPEPLEAMLMPSHCSTMFHWWCCKL